MRRLVCVGLAASAFLATPAVASTTALRIELWPHGRGVGVAKTRTLRCGPVGGTLPNAVRACRLLSLLRDPFAPVPPGRACADIFGGPQVAIVSGTFRGRRVWAVFKRTDSCQTERWNRVAFLFA